VFPNTYLVIGVNVALTIVSWVISGVVTITWMKATMKAKTAEFERRLDAGDAEREKFVRREEFDSRVGRVERQIDGGLGLKGAVR